MYVRGELCVRLQGTGVSTGGRAHSPMSDSFSRFSQEKTRKTRVRQKVQPLRLDKIVFSDHGDTVHARIPCKFYRSQPARLPRLGALAKRGQQSAEGALRRPSQGRHGDESRCPNCVDPGGSKRGEEEHRELAQAIPPVHR